MGGASKGRVGKKQRNSKLSSASRTSRSSAAVKNSMRRGPTRLSRSSPGSRNHVNLAAIDDLFNRFKEPGEEKIGPEGMQALFDVLGVDPLNIIALIFAWKLKAKVPFEFKREEFVNGCVTLNCDSLEKLKTVLPTLRESLNNEADFRSFYMFAFEYNKPPEQRSLPIETARQLFPLILEGRFLHLDLWIEFLQGRKNAISRDTYSLLLDFTRSVDQDLSNYDGENGAWPVLLDEFVDFAKPRIQASKDHMDT